jgi:hypothetical protein
MDYSVKLNLYYFIFLRILHYLELQNIYYTYKHCLKLNEIVLKIVKYIKY